MASKNFNLVNPAEAMLNPQGIIEQTGNIEEPIETNSDLADIVLPTGYVIKEEARSKHIHLLLQPSLLKSLDKYCKKNKVSRNRFIEEAIKEALKDK